MSIKHTKWRDITPGRRFKCYNDGIMRKVYGICSESFKLPWPPQAVSAGSPTAPPSEKQLQQLSVLGGTGMEGSLTKSRHFSGTPGKLQHMVTQAL